MSAAPIFVGGLAYSGKTPLRAALGTHPDVSMTRKSWLWDRFYGRFGDLSEAGNLDRCLAELVTDPYVGRLQPDEARIRRELADGPPTYARLFGLVHAHHAERQGRSRWGEQVKTIERFADPVFDAFPDARMIHMIRDPRARFAATSRRGPGAVGWHTAMWRGSVELAERNLARHVGGYVVVRFETLADEPAATLDDVCAFLGLTATDEMVEVLLSGLHAETPEAASPAQRAFVDRYAGPTLPAFGYARLPVPTAKDRVVAALARPVNRATMAAWRLTAGRTVHEAVPR